MKYPSPLTMVAMCVATAGWYNRKGAILEFSFDRPQAGRLLTDTPAIKAMLPNITLFEDVCPQEFPPLHAKIHDRRPENTAEYIKHMSMQSTALNDYGDSTPHGQISNRTTSDVPPMVTLDKNPNYAIWKMQGMRYVGQSAWNDDDGEDNYVRGVNYCKTKHRDGRRMKPSIVLDDGGDYAAHTSWFEGNFGHFVHDHLPTIALLRAHLPKTTKFLLMDTKVTRNILKTLNPDWMENNVVWLEFDQMVQIRNGGTLTVAVTSNLPEIGGCCRQYDFMRQWAAEKHFQMSSDNLYIREPNHEEKFVIFYRRLPNKDLHHGRTLDIELEQEVMHRIQQAMKKYGRKERFTTYTGDYMGRSLTINEQLIKFRRASTIIGPHGSGVGGNLLWTNPFARTCDERVKLLEFVPDRDSAQVQNAYAHYWSQWRKWPIDYHTVIYQPQSTHGTTYINLDDLDDALEAMWGPAPAEAAVEVEPISAEGSEVVTA